jgi:hypothetical protein
MPRALLHTCWICSNAGGAQASISALHPAPKTIDLGQQRPTRDDDQHAMQKYRSSHAKIDGQVPTKSETVMVDACIDGALYDRTIRSSTCCSFGRPSVFGPSHLYCRRISHRCLGVNYWLLDFALVFGPLAARGVRCIARYFTRYFTNHPLKRVSWLSN